jgi:hypothetical protein
VFPEEAIDPGQQSQTVDVTLLHPLANTDEEKVVPKSVDFATTHCAFPKVELNVM